jgi:D-tyrosyl-tRNA(Tyr) deacylase
VRAVVQRVSEARVLVDADVAGEIGAGLCVLLGVADADDQDTAGRLAHKVAGLRIFENELIADTGKGNRPSFSHAARPEQAEPLYEAFCGALEDEGVDVARGVFGARMSVELANDGPVTILLET